jgi:pimeloyl-ACP methyl ester carboxylesterase
VKSDATTMTTSALPVPQDPAGTFVGEVHVVIDGEPHRPAVALLHGIPGSTRDFRYLGPAIAEEGLCAVRIDMPGFGKTPKRAFSSPRSVDRAVFVKSTMRALGFERFAVGGHSFGGGAALLCAALFPEAVTAFVGMNSIGPRRHRGLTAPPSFLKGVAHAMSMPLLGVALHRLVVQAYESRGLKSDIPLDLSVVQDQTAMVGALSFKELRQAAHLVKAPSLVVSSRTDRLVEPASSFALARALRGAPLVSHLHVAEGGHFLQKHEARAVAAWLARHVAG